jgi:hypothetical protein
MRNLRKYDLIRNEFCQRLTQTAPEFSHDAVKALLYIMAAELEGKVDERGKPLEDALKPIRDLAGKAFRDSVGIRAPKALLYYTNPTWLEHVYIHQDIPRLFMSLLKGKTKQNIQAALDYLTQECGDRLCVCGQPLQTWVNQMRKDLAAVEDTQTGREQFLTNIANVEALCEYHMHDVLFQAPHWRKTLKRIKNAVINRITGSPHIKMTITIHSVGRPADSHSGESKTAEKDEQ